MMTLKFKRIGNHDLPLPAYESEYAAGMDLRAANDCVLYPLQEVLIPLGFAVEIPNPYSMILLPRSGLGSKSGIVLGNLIGLIDPDYRGELMAKVWYRRAEGAPFTINRGDRICQALLIPRIVSDIIEVSELSETARGKGGFGHSGTK